MRHEKHSSCFSCDVTCSANTHSSLIHYGRDKEDSARLMYRYVHERMLHPLRWRHNRSDSVSNHQPHHCLLNRLFRRRSKKTSKFRVTGLCVGNSPGAGEFPAQMASNAENVSIWWRHHGNYCNIPLAASQSTGKRVINQIRYRTLRGEITINQHLSLNAHICCILKTTFKVLPNNCICATR